MSNIPSARSTSSSAHASAPQAPFGPSRQVALQPYPQVFVGAPGAAASAAPQAAYGHAPQAVFPRPAAPQPGSTVAGNSQQASAPPVGAQHAPARGLTTAGKVILGVGAAVSVAGGAVIAATELMRRGYTSYHGAGSADACMQAFGCQDMAYDQHAHACSVLAFVPGSFESGGVMVPYAGYDLVQRAPEEVACLTALHHGDVLRLGGILVGAGLGTLGLVLVGAAIACGRRPQPQLPTQA